MGQPGSGGGWVRLGSTRFWRRVGSVFCFGCGLLPCTEGPPTTSCSIISLWHWRWSFPSNRGPLSLPPCTAFRLSPSALERYLRILMMEASGRPPWATWLTLLWAQKVLCQFLEIAEIEKALTASLAIVSSFYSRRLCCPGVGHLHGADLVVAGLCCGPLPCCHSVGSRCGGCGELTWHLVSIFR